MVIATCCNLAVAMGLLWFNRFMWDVLGDPAGAAAQRWVATSLVIIGLVLSQGIVLPVYAWWRWFGDRDMGRMVDGVVKALQESTSSENAARLRQQAAQIRRQQDEIRRLIELRNGLDVSSPQREGAGEPEGEFAPSVPLEEVLAEEATNAGTSGEPTPSLLDPIEALRLSFVKSPPRAPGPADPQQDEIRRQQDEIRRLSELRRRQRNGGLKGDR
jgi:hypothetical protein